MQKKKKSLHSSVFLWPIPSNNGIFSAVGKAKLTVNFKFHEQ